MKSQTSMAGRYSGKCCFELIRLKYTPRPEELLVRHHKTRGTGSVVLDASDLVLSLGDNSDTLTVYGA